MIFGKIEHIEPDTDILISVEEYKELLENNGKYEMMRGMMMNNGKPLVCPRCKGVLEDLHPDTTPTEARYCVVCGSIFLVETEEECSNNEHL
jgi:hypothetical protein